MNLVDWLVNSVGNDVILKHFYLGELKDEKQKH